MMGFFESAYVVGRRDFTATVFSKVFFFFLLGPVIVIGMSLLFGNIGQRMAQQDLRSKVAVVASEAEFEAIAAARERLAPAFDEFELAELVHAEPDYVIEAQVNDLLESREQRILAVLTGGIDQPRLTGAVSETGSIREQIRLIIEEARQQRAISRSGTQLLPVEVEFVQVEESAGSIASLRAVTARGAQLLLFMVTVFLAGMLLSNFVEEKSNKVVEVLAAAVPVNAIFVGKLFAMLLVSLVGLAVWGLAILIGLMIWPIEGFDLPSPAVGWPLFVPLILIYYCANYLLLGALFLGIGAQASSVREVQTLSMPVTIGQVIVFLFASFAVGPYNGLIGIAAAVVPFSSPLAMAARAAQTPELWTHLLAIVWQALWVWLTLKLAAGLFRRNVLKSGSASASRSGGGARPTAT
jgi:ABC-2 type transport system permease protein